MTQTPNSDAAAALARETGEIALAHRPTATLVKGLLIAWSLFQLYLSSGLGPMLSGVIGVGLINDIYARALHLFFGGVLCFLLFPARSQISGARHIPWYDGLLAVVIGLACLWQAVFFAEIISTTGRTRSFDIPILGSVPFEFVLGWCAILLTLEAARRAVGTPLAVIGGVFVLYTLFNSHLPPPLGLSDVSSVRFVTAQWFGQEGIFGIPLGVSTKTIFLFVLFGALLDKGGAGKWFIDLAFAAVGFMRGGPAKSAVLASGMTGMISGSSIANTVTTGTFTIPIMMRNGYPAAKAGAIEVASSVNGQIMPPIMGAAAFVMAEILGVPYFDIIAHAFIPAIISYIALFYIVHLEALKLGLKPAQPPERARVVFKRGWQYLTPILILIVGLMVFRLSPDRSVFYSILVLVGVFFAEKLVRGADAQIVVRETFEVVVAGLVSGARGMITVAIAVAAAGLVMGSIGASGLSNALQEVLTAIAGTSIIPILLATAVLSIILGMGLPTTANYLIVSTLMVGIVSTMGQQAGFVFPLVAIHLFCFYFGLMADVTPPVGLAAFAAASISRADPIRTGFQAFWYSARTAILPFVFLFNAELLLIGVKSFAEGVLIFAASLAAILGFTALTQGWFLKKLRLGESCILAVSVLILFQPGLLQSQVFPQQWQQHEAAALDQGLAVDALHFRVVTILDEHKTLVMSRQDTGGALSWSALGLGAQPSVLHEGGTQVTVRKFSGAGAAGGFQNGMTILEILEPESRPHKYWFYIPGAMLLLLVLCWQRLGRRD